MSLSNNNLELLRNISKYINTISILSYSEWCYVTGALRSSLSHY